MARRSRSSCTAASAAVVLLSACGGSIVDLSAPGDDNSLPENRGTVVASALSTSGASAVSVTPGGSWAAVGDGYRRILLKWSGDVALDTVYSMTNQGNMFGVWFRPDGSGFYFFETRSTSTTQYLRSMDLSDREITTLTDRLSNGFQSSFSNGDGSTAVISSLSNRVAYIVSPDSLFLHDARTGAVTFHGTGCRAPVLFTYDDQGVLCVSQSSGQRYSTVSLSNPPQVAQQFTVFPDSIASRTVEVQWTAQKISVVHSQFLGQPSGLTLKSTAGDSVAIPSLSGQQVMPIVALSRNGQRIAYWRSFCAREDAWFSCGKTQYLLFSRDLPNGAERRVAVTSVTPRYMTVSDDGSQLYYHAGGTLYFVGMN